MSVHLPSAGAPVTIGLPSADLPVTLHPSARVLAGGRILVGGRPLRLLRLTGAGATVVADWRGSCVPARIGTGAARGRLARRLLDAGVLTPRPPAAATTVPLTVVVPVRDRPAQLERCLDAIARACPGSPVIVVDDGSRLPEPVQAACSAAGARLIRHHAPRGPAAARNAGLAACETGCVLFVDSDVVLAPDCAARLLGHLADPCVGAVAPRIGALAATDSGGGAVAGYERRHSALDMGSRGGLVAPGAPVSYVPSAVLLARREALGAGFDESLRAGEDVDLVWRLCRAGWRVRYAAEIDARHEHRTTLGAFVADRRRYARTAPDLHRRHPGSLPAARLSADLVLPWALWLGGRPGAATAAVALAVVRRRARLRATATAASISPTGLAAVAVARGLAGTGGALGHAARRAWAPPLGALALRGGSARRGMLLAYAAPAARAARDALADRAPAAIPADVALALLAELATLAGTWEGCVRRRTLGPLLPSFRRAP